MEYYVLKNKVAKKSTLNEYKKYYADNDPMLWKDVIHQMLRVETHFLGLDMMYSSKPRIFETVVYGGKYNGFSRCYSTYKKASEGHQEILKMVKP